MATNIGLEFNKRVYLNLRNEHLQNMQYRLDNMQLYETLIKTKLADLLPEQLNLKDKIREGYESFNLTTSGQGFLIGTGNEHGTGVKVKVEKTINGQQKIEEIESHEFKMGFHFDHSTGIPVITGHNLKGIIRSFFPIAYKAGIKKDAIANRLHEELRLCFQNDKSLKIDSWNIAKINMLENILFEGRINDEKRINPLIQDIFLGAFPSKSNSKEFDFSIPKHYIFENKNGIKSDKYDKEEIVKIPSGTFLFDDTLAYHPHPLKDPMPIRLLKILPDVEITFQFRLNDEGGLSGKQKATLFEYLLKKYGAGAKTSSGYGQFEKEVLKTNLSGLPIFPDFNPISLSEASIENDEPQVPTEMQPESTLIYQNESWIDFSIIKNGDIVEGTVIKYENGNARVQLHIIDKEIVLGIQGKFKTNDILKIKVIETSGSHAKGNFNIVKIRSI